MTLDAFVEQEVSGRVGFVKIDAEGHEAEILKGAEQVLRSHRPILLMEIERRHTGKSVAEQIAAVEALGYVGNYLEPGAWYLAPATEFDEERDQGAPDSGRYINNFFFLPADGGG